MNEFKIGDEVWFFSTSSGRYNWNDTTIIYEEAVEIEQGTIVLVNADADYVHVYVPPMKHVCVFGYSFFDDYVYKTKNEAINAMIKKLESMRND